VWLTEKETEMKTVKSEKPVVAKAETEKQMAKILGESSWSQVLENIQALDDVEILKQLEIKALKRRSEILIGRSADICRVLVVAEVPKKVPVKVVWYDGTEYPGTFLGIGNLDKGRVWCHFPDEPKDRTNIPASLIKEINGLSVVVTANKIELVPIAKAEKN
jgi:hypothetical protein